METKADYFAEADIPTRVDWINNPAINNTMFFELPADVQKTGQWFKNKRADTRVDFTFRNGDSIIAMGGFTGIDRVNGHAEFYVMVHPDMHGKGHGKKVSQWLYNFAFLQYGLNKIYLYTNDSNVSAYKIYEDSGFQLEGVLRAHKWKNGSFQNRRFYGLLRTEWELATWKQNEIKTTF